MPEELGKRPGESVALKMVRNGFSVRIGFELPENAVAEVSMSGYRDQLLQLIEVPECCMVTFDMTGITAPPRGLVGFLASAQECGCEVELLNPSAEVQEILRLVHVDSRLLIRGAT